MADFHEVELKTSEITNVKWVRYKRRKPDPPPKFEFVNQLILYTPKGTFLLAKRERISQFLRQLGLSYNKLVKQPDKEQLILGTCRELDKTIKLAYSPGVVHNFVTRVVSGEFTGIPHSQLLSMIHRILQKKGLKYEKREIEFSRGMFAAFIFDLKHEPEAHYRALYVFNYNDGRHAVKMWGGLFVVKCGNPILMTSARVIHRGGAVLMDLEKKMLGLVEFVKRLDVNARLRSMTYEEAMGVIRGLYSELPQYAVYQIEQLARQRLYNPDGRTTNWVLANVLTYYVPRKPWPDYVKFKLMERARQVLTR